MLPAEGHAGPELEVAALAAEPPDDPAGVPVDLVDRVGVAGRHEQIAVVVDGDRVDVEVVVGAVGITRQAVVGLDQRDVADAVPLEQHSPGLDVELLKRSFEHRSAFDLNRVRQRHQRRVARRDHELVHVPCQSIPGPDVPDQPV